MKSIRRTKRSLEDYGIRSEERSIRSQRPKKTDASQKLESYLNKVCEAHQTQKQTTYLDDSSDLSNHQMIHVGFVFFYDLSL